MAKYEQYDNYEELESIFVEKIPAHWNVKPLYALCGFKQGKAHEPFIDDDGEFICVNARFVSTQGRANSLKRCNVNLTPAKLHDILMVMSDLPNGRALARAFYVEESKNNYAVNQRVCAITTKKVHAKFLYYQLNRSPYFLMFNDGSNQTHLSNDAYKKYPVLLPSTIEQEKIANFLDFETAQIDTLIEKQQTLIQLLKEKRQAVISHAVTKGLNPDAPMKDSGVEWLGGIPSNWSVGALKYWADIIDCKHITAEFVEDGYPLASISEVKEWTVNLSTSKFTTKKYYLELIENGRKPVIGDILYSRNATVGEAALVIDDMPDFAMGQDICLIRSNDKILSEYIMYVLNSGIIKKQLDLAMVGSTFKRINVDNIRNFDISFPSLYEQQEIIDILKINIAKYDSLILQAEQAIQLMQERRTALISAAVTGKIDVRGWRAADNKAS